MAGDNNLYSVEQVAARLGLHVRTVRNYVRDGRLKAVRIGKQYRISPEQLNELTGQGPTPTVASMEPQDPSRRYVEVSSIVQVEAIEAELANKVTNALIAAGKGPREDDQPLRIDTIYDPERKRLKVILTGGISATATLLKFLGAFYLQP